MNILDIFIKNNSTDSSIFQINVPWFQNKQTYKGKNVNLYSIKKKTIIDEEITSWNS